MILDSVTKEDERQAHIRIVDEDNGVALLAVTINNPRSENPQISVTLLENFVNRDNHSVRFVFRNTETIFHGGN